MPSTLRINFWITNSVGDSILFFCSSCGLVFFLFSVFFAAAAAAAATAVVMNRFSFTQEIFVSIEFQMMMNATRTGPTGVSVLVNACGANHGA